jgi:hypothetical protein
MRYLGIDLARSVAVFCVVVGHAMMAANVQEGGTAFYIFRLFTSVSAPVFYCLFGCMLQLVYTRQYAAGAENETSLRLLTRALQCWILYCITCAAFCVFAGLPFTYFIRCALFLGETPLTDILKFYAVLLFFAPLLVGISSRIGLWPIILFCVVVQAAYPLISHISPMHGYPGAEALSAFIYGGEYVGHTGPSILHGLSFVTFGMVLGRVWQARPGREFLLSGPDWGMRGVFGLMIAATIAWVILGKQNLLDPVVRVTLINENHPLFLLFGCTATIAFIDIFTAIRRMAGIGEKSIWMVFGRTSLFTFCYGSVILYAVSLNDPAAAPDPARVIWSTLVVMVMSLAYAAFRDGPVKRINHPLMRAYRWLVDDSTPRIVRFLMQPFLDCGGKSPDHGTRLHKS